MMFRDLKLSNPENKNKLSFKIWNVISHINKISKSVQHVDTVWSYIRNKRFLLIKFSFCVDSFSESI